MGFFSGRLCRCDLFLRFFALVIELECEVWHGYIRYEASADCKSKNNF